MRVPYSLQLAFAAGVVALALVPLVMRLATAIGAVDHPGERRVHRAPVPTLGGLAIAAAVLLVAWVARVLPGPARELDPMPLLGLTLAAIPILALGMVDDVRGTSPWTKLAVQSCAALVLTQFGYGVPQLSNPFGAPIETGPWSGVLVLVWLLVVINAINLIDGLDGLAAGVVTIASISLWTVGRMHGDFYVMFLAALLIGACAGFLRWNFPPARTFMGDTGSHFLGLVLAAMSLLENRKGTVTLTLLFPIMALAVPLLDSVLAFVRRARRGRDPFGADADHIHHRLLKLGLSPRRATLVLWITSAAFGALALVLERLPHGWELTIVAILAVALFGALEAARALGRRTGE